MSTLSKLRRLVLRQDVSVREASRKLGISRNTARECLCVHSLSMRRERANCVRWAALTPWWLRRYWRAWPSQSPRKNCGNVP